MAIILTVNKVANWGLACCGRVGFMPPQCVRKSKYLFSLVFFLTFYLFVKTQIKVHADKQQRVTVTVEFMIVLTYSAVALLLLHMQTTKFCTCWHVCVSWCEMHFFSATARATTAVASAKLCLTAMRVLDWFSLLPLKSY